MMEVRSLYEEVFNTCDGESRIRKIAVQEKLAPIEEIAVMSLKRICDLVQDKFIVTYRDNGAIGLIRKDDFPKFLNMIRVLK